MPSSRESSQPRDPTRFPALQVDSLPSEPPESKYSFEFRKLLDVANCSQLPFASAANIGIIYEHLQNHSLKHREEQENTCSALLENNASLDLMLWEWEDEKPPK